MMFKHATNNFSNLHRRYYTKTREMYLLIQQHLPLFRLLLQDAAIPLHQNPDRYAWLLTLTQQEGSNQRAVQHLHANLFAQQNLESTFSKFLLLWQFGRPQKHASQEYQYTTDVNHNHSTKTRKASTN